MSMQSKCASVHTQSAGPGSVMPQARSDRSYKIWSETAQAWIPARAVKPTHSGLVTVEFKIPGSDQLHRKHVHMTSSQLVVGDTTPDGYEFEDTSADGAASLPRSLQQSSAVSSLLTKAPRTCIIGAGVLGKRIIAELLLLGSEVAVFDTALAQLPPEQALAEINQDVKDILQQCARNGLLDIAGMSAPSDSGKGFSINVGGKPTHFEFRCCASIADASSGADIVIEAVPDRMDIKRNVFVEAATSAPAEVLLATSTLSLPLARLSAEVANAGVAAPRVVGLRFLAPVMFIPFVEITSTNDQMKGKDRQDLLAILHLWRKSAFQCDIQNAAGHGDENPFLERWNERDRAAKRLRLDGQTARKRQVAEARLRAAHRAGPEAVAKLTSAEIFEFAEATCCICMSCQPTVTSVMCGHRVMCADCAEVAAQTNPVCPLCRVRFVAEV